MDKDNVLITTFDKIDGDYHFFLECLRGVLQDMGERELAAVVPTLDVDPVTEKSNGKSVNPEKEMHLLSVVFQLLNLVEENAAAQTRRLRETKEGVSREPGLWGQNLKQLIKLGITQEEIANRLRTIHVEPVLTAHPTEAKRPTVLQIHRTLYLLLVQLENQMWTPMEREEIKRQIKSHLERLLRTGEIFYTKPNVASELDNVLYYLREVFPAVLTKLDLRLRQSWAEAGFDEALISDPDGWPRLTFGNWVGGDRDGHPLVTAEVTESTLRKLRETGTKVIEEQLLQLLARLSLSSELQEPPAVLMQGIRKRIEQLGLAGQQAAQRNPLEPWRQFVALMLESVHRPSSEGGYRRASELTDDLRLLRTSLIEVRAGRIAEQEIIPVERIVSVFGFHLAALDVRQNSRFHDEAVRQLLIAAGSPDVDFPSWSEERRLAFLNQELLYPRPFTTKKTRLDMEAESVLSCYRVLSQQLDDFGGDGLGSLIISMTRSLSDLLVVYLLAREVGLCRLVEGGLACDLPVVPLFETLEDLEKAPGILQAFLRHPVTKRSQKLRGINPPVQQVMVGYSDSNKDGGYLASQWNLSKAQRTLATVGAQCGVHVCFFHGRGGTPSRGAGPTHRFLEALPHGSLTGNFRMTEQGETIAQKYANAITATYNLELLLAGVTATTLKHSQALPPDTDLESIMERLTETSRAAYRGLVESDGFITYWEQATPIDALERSAIGSRPSRRTGKRSLEDLRAIPWVFSWNQSRHYLPGWYGLGTALQKLQEADPDAFDLVSRRASDWTILRNTLYNAETSLASADLQIMADYAGLVESADVRDRVYQRIAEEHRRTQAMIDRIFHAPREERRPRMIKTLRLRESGLQRLHRHQINLLRQWRQARANGDEAREEALLPSVLLSINAVASGLRTTG